MKLAASCNIPLSEFWEMNIPELILYANAHNERLNKEWDGNIIRTFLLSRWVWTKNVEYKKLLSDQIQNPKEMTDEQMLNQVKSLNALFGGDVIG